jgi:hypothetical protein
MPTTSVRPEKLKKQKNPVRLSHALSIPYFLFGFYRPKGLVFPKKRSMIPMRNLLFLFKNSLQEKNSLLYHLSPLNFLTAPLLYVEINCSWSSQIYFFTFQKQSESESVAHALMDVDPTPSSAATGPAAVVCLPYSLVPGLDTSSNSYQKAVSTLGKQPTVPVSTTGRVPLISVLDRGSSLFYLSKYIC